MMAPLQFFFLNRGNNLTNLYINLFKLLENSKHHVDKHSEFPIVFISNVMT